MERLDLLGQRARPTTLAAERSLPVAPALAPLLPGGHLVRGTTVGVAGIGATSLALGLVAAASAAGSWTVAVGLDDLGLVAAAEAGVDLARLVLVDAPPPERWGTVVAALVETIELVLVRPTARVRDADDRRLAAHLRSRGGVLVRLPGVGSWPGSPDVTLRAVAPDWQGTVPPSRLDGAGRLRSRRLVVEATGRGRAARPRRVELWLPGPDGVPAPVLDRPAGDRRPVPERTAGGADRRVVARREAAESLAWADAG
ncbi:MAG TPA: hypothetical protein VFU19_01930 [Iamia sp.]|nr:hypothetical protein [Iamia sp.]